MALMIDIINANCSTLTSTLAIGDSLAKDDFTNKQVMKYLRDEMSATMLTDILSICKEV